jgi:hypothetical protein
VARDKDVEDAGAVTHFHLSKEEGTNAHARRKKHNRAIIAADVKRFGHVINKDGILGTHREPTEIADGS